MTTNILFLHLFRFGIYIALQIFLFKGLNLFDFAFCFMYIGAILALPKEINHVYLILVSFITGLIVDAFYNTMGIHTAACLLVGYLRPYVLALITPQQRGYDEKSDFTVQSMGLIWYLSYASILIFIHLLLIFYLEIGSFSMFFTTFLKVICSVIFTIFVLIVMQYFNKK